MEDRDLTAKEIKEVDELYYDKLAMDHTLKVALNFHSNMRNSLMKKEKAWWGHIIERMDLDKTVKWVVDRSGAILCIKMEEK